MTMTKKDYELIARVFKDCRPYVALKTDTEHWTEHLAQQMAESLKTTNPLFDEVRFLLACGFSVEVRGIEQQQ